MIRLAWQGAQTDVNWSLIVAVTDAAAVGLAVVVANGIKWTSPWNTSAEAIENVPLPS
jgi:hypothetical protein